METKAPIFAYLRRSTSKEEQAESLIQQEDGIGSIIKRLGFEKESITYFAETYSGFENKKRKKWGELLEAVDRSKTPCIILTRDISRLSRNPTDSQGIMDRLYGDNKKKRLIDKIYSLDYDGIKTWDRTTDKEEVHRALSASYYDSLDTRRKSVGGILLKLEDRQFPYAAPKGLESVKIGNRRILKQSDLMPFVRRAFEMKTEGWNHKVISRYLRQNAGIRILDRHLTDRFFRNPIYIGEYTEKTTGKHFPKLDFVEWHPPISRALWDKTQKYIGRTISQYGEKQEWHLLESRIRSESGHAFSKYVVKQIYPSYKGRFKDASGEEIFIHISERQILEAFLKIVVKMVSDFSQKFLMAYEGEITMTATQVVAREGTNMKNSQTAELFRKNVEESKRSGEQMMPQEGLDAFADAIDDYVCKLGLLTAGREFFDQQPGGFAKHLEKSLAKAKKKKTLQGMSEDYFARKLLMDKGMELYRESGKPYVFNEETGYDPIGSLDRRFRTAKQTVGRSIAVERIAEALKKQFDTNTRDFKEAKANQVRALEKRKEEIESERKNYRREALKMGYAREEIEETTKDMDSDLRALESRISDLSRDTEMERYLDRLPEMLLETVELASNGISRAKIEDLRADLKTLLEISTVELTVTNKKELQVKLFEVLEGLISSDGDLLEAPSGVEPLSKALQASV